MLNSRFIQDVSPEVGGGRGLAIAGVSLSQPHTCRLAVSVAKSVIETPT